MENAIKRDARFGEAYLRLGGYYKLVGNKNFALENYRKGISLLPFNPALAGDYLVLADLSFNSGDYKLAEENYNNFLKANPISDKQIAFAQLQL